MTDIHHEILDPKQVELVPLISRFSSPFYLVGGTALALQYGHRRSIDFDLFTDKLFDNQKIRNTIRKDYPIEQTFIDSREELTLLVTAVKCTFYYYPYPIIHPIGFTNGIFMPDPITIAAMKAFALGRRAKWKDYVDLYFVFQNHSLHDIVTRAKKVFQQEFDEKLFREQLAYHQDINYSDAVIFMPGFEVPNNQILEFLIQKSVS